MGGVWIQPFPFSLSLSLSFPYLHMKKKFASHACLCISSSSSQTLTLTLRRSGLCREKNVSLKSVKSQHNVFLRENFRRFENADFNFKSCNLTFGTNRNNFHRRMSNNVNYSNFLHSRVKLDLGIVQMFLVYIQSFIFSWQN